MKYFAPAHEDVARRDAALTSLNRHGRVTVAALRPRITLSIPPVDIISLRLQLDGDGLDHCGGCCCSTRDRCRIVSLILGRCLVMRSKIRLALSRLEPANNSSAIRWPSLRPLLDLVEVAPVSIDRIVGLFVRPAAHLHRAFTYASADQAAWWPVHKYRTHRDQIPRIFPTRLRQFRVSFGFEATQTDTRSAW
jgi:hypothetical protein